jgi:hypothetical protein
MIYSTDNIKDGDGKLFSWNCAEDGKRDWSTFLMKLRTLMGEKRWVMDEAATAAQMPGEQPEAPPAAANYTVRAAYQDRMGKWNSGNQKVEVAFYYAISKTCEAFDTGCMAAYQIQQALARPEGTEPEDWTAVKQFRAVMDMLKANYACSTDADVAALRLRLSQLNDSGPDGFHGFQREFVQVLTMLKATKADAVTDRELTQWVKGAIRNSYVNSTLLMKWYVETDDITYDQILTRVTRLLVELANHDEDPYRSASGSKGSVAAHVAKTADGVTFGGCTKCWGTGHWFKACAARQCQVCKAALGKTDRSCPNWKSHPVGFRFYNDVAPWDRVRGQSSNGGSGGGHGKRKAESSGHSGGGEKRSHYEPSKTDPTAEIERLKKALKASRKKTVKANRAAKKAAAAQAEEED